MAIHKMVPATLTLEQRVEQLEKELAQLKQQVQAKPNQSDQPWWEKLVGVFADDPILRKQWNWVENIVSL